MKELELPAAGGQSDISRQYFAALGDYTEFGHETRLVRAYDLARDALRDGISLAELSGLHHVALNELFDVSDDRSAEQLDRLEQFFLEVIAVYDMALQGYKSSVQSLEAENLRRRGTEHRLRIIKEELKRQRDGLDVQVQMRTAELAQKAADLEELNTRLHHTNREQAEFTYAISHDLKSPVNTIGMLLNELVLDCGDDLDPDGMELIEMSLRTVERMGSLIEDVLKYSRTVDGELELEPINLNAILADIVADLHGDISEHGIQLEIADLPVVLGNKFQLRILFRNLLSNAFKFRDPDRVPQVRVLCERDPESSDLTISVADNGIGIEPRFHDKIFALFQRLYTHDAFPGSGLGLTLCRRIAHNHHGAINVFSTPGQGSTFSLVMKGDGHDK